MASQEPGAGLHPHQAEFNTSLCSVSGQSKLTTPPLQSLGPAGAPSPWGWGRIPVLSAGVLLPRNLRGTRREAVSLGCVTRRGP